MRASSERERESIREGQVLVPRAASGQVSAHIRVYIYIGVREPAVRKNGYLHVRIFSRIARFLRFCSCLGLLYLAIIR